MQALIDYEGWRKWRGFLDSPRPSSPDHNSAASPMQGGSQHASMSQPEPASPSVDRQTAKSKPSRHKLQRPHIPDAEQILREDSWASGSGSGSGDTADSALSPLTDTPPDPGANPPRETTSAQ